MHFLYVWFSIVLFLKMLKVSHSFYFSPLFLSINDLKKIACSSLPAPWLPRKEPSPLSLFLSLFRLGDTLLGANVSSVTPSGGFGFRWGSEDGRDSEQQPRLSIDLRVQRGTSSGFPNHGPQNSNILVQVAGKTALWWLSCHEWFIAAEPHWVVQLSSPCESAGSRFFLGWIPRTAPELFFFLKSSGKKNISLNLSSLPSYKLFLWALKRMDAQN